MLVFCAHWPLPVRGSGRGHGVLALQPKAVRPSVRSVCLAIEALSVLQTKEPSLVGVFLTAATALLGQSVPGSHKNEGFTVKVMGQSFIELVTLKLD